MKKIIKFIMIFSISIILVLSFSSITGFAASTDNKFTGYSTGLSEEQLEKATTKAYFGDVNYPSENYTYDSITNNLDESSPLLTVLVHGYGSNASIWSNNFEFLSDNEVGDESIDVNFTYDPNSLIERLRKISNANVYYGTMTSINEFELYRITDLSDNYSDVKEFYEENGYITTELLNSIDYIQNGEVVKQISDISKHSIVIFESNGPWDSNKDEYDRLNTMIDKIVYDIKILNQNKLPKINLISHSRGGLTVMQYVLNHPHLVNDVFTIGAPYLGSKLGNSDLLLGIIGENDPGTNDILDPNLYTAYQERWNDNYESLKYLYER